MAITFNNTVSNIAQLAQQLGLDTWQLQTGKYHNWVFHTVDTTLDIISKNFNPVNGLAGAVTSTVGSFSGNNGGINTGFATQQDPPYGTNTQSMRSVNSSRKKYVINHLPNGKDNVQYLGFNGEDFEFDVMVWGISYDTIIRNIQQVYVSDTTAYQTLGNDFRTLYHPIYGKVPNCHFLNYEVTYTSQAWRAAIVKLYFHSEQPISGNNPYNQSTLTTQIASFVRNILNLTFILNNGWSQVEALLNSFGGGGGTTNAGGSNPTNVGNLSGITNVLSARTNVLNTNATAVSIAQILIANLGPSGYSNQQLNQAQGVGNNELNYYQTHFSPNDINNLLSYFASNVNQTIASVNAIGGNQYYDSINNLNSLLSSINQLSQNLLNSYYGNVTSYTVPIDMTLYEVCANNSINFNSALDKIVQLNKGILYWMTKIKSGTIILLPKLGVT